MIELRSVRKQYGQGDAAVQALAGIDLTLRVGEMVAVMGPSGSGKSTLLNILGLLDRLDCGSYLFFGEDMTRLSSAKAADLRGRSIGFVFQGIFLLPRLSAIANVELPMMYARVPRRERLARAKSALEQVGMGQLARRFPNQLSGGQAQRVAVARAVALRPNLLLADEPTGALDRHSGREVLSLFQDLHQSMGITIVIVTHDPGVAAHAERLIEMEDGKILGDGPVKGRLFADGGEHSQ